MSNVKNYTIKLNVQCESDAAALAKTAEIAMLSKEVAYLNTNNRNLGFFTKEGDYGMPVALEDQLIRGPLVRGGAS